MTGQFRLPARYTFLLYSVFFVVVVGFFVLFCFVLFFCFFAEFLYLLEFTSESMRKVTFVLISL